ncbi:unnamed protein product, partial [marine sediment metagenome]
PASALRKWTPAPSDALNFAVRTGAPIFVDKEVAEQCLMKGKDGKPLSPRAAWNQMARRYTPTARPGPFRDISHVLRTIAKDPQNMKARQALSVVEPLRLGPMLIRRIPSMIRDTTGGMDKLESWVRRRKGTGMEGVAHGLLGAVYLWTQRPHEAIPYLEKAYQLCPKDGRVAFDLASAHAMVGTLDKALSALKKLDGQRQKLAQECGNFSVLWPSQRFRAIVG